MMWRKSCRGAPEGNSRLERISAGRVRRAAAIALMCGSLLAFESANAQSPLETARIELAEATERVEELSLEIAQAQGRADAATARYWEHQETVYVLEEAIGGLSDTIDDYDTEIDDLAKDLQRAAIARYMQPENFEVFLDTDALNRKLRGDALASIVTGTSGDVVSDYRLAIDDRQTSLADLEDRLAVRDEAAAAASEAGASLTAELQTLHDQRSDLLDELDELASRLAELEAEESKRQAAAAEQQRLDEERARAEAAQEAAAEVAEAAPTPEPTTSAFQPSDITRTSGVLGEPEEARDDTAAADEPSDPEPSDPEPSDTEPSGSESSGTEPSNAVASDVEPGDLQAETTVVGEPVSGLAPSLPVEPATAAAAPIVLATPVPQIIEVTPLPPDPAPAFVCPLDGAFSHIDDYGAPRPGGNSHQGNDLMAAAGTPVLAVVSGQLEHKFGNVGGYTARIKADDGGWYYFAHLSAYENQGAGYVEAGTVIGYVGNTGDAISTPPHLHFEMHPAGYGIPINPFPVIAQHC